MSATCMELAHPRPNTVVLPKLLCCRAKIVATTGHEEDIVYGDIDFSTVREVRAAIPIRHQKRPDVYGQK